MVEIESQLVFKNGATFHFSLNKLKQQLGFKNESDVPFLIKENEDGSWFFNINKILLSFHSISHLSDFAKSSSFGNLYAHDIKESSFFYLYNCGFEITCDDANSIDSFCKEKSYLKAAQNIESYRKAWLANSSMEQSPSIDSERKNLIEAFLDAKNNAISCFSNEKNAMEFIPNKIRAKCIVSSINRIQNEIN